MASFAPVYRPSKPQQSFLVRESKRERKRKREAEDDGETLRASPGRSPSPEADEQWPSLYPVNKTDPYHIAGHPRGRPLPGSNFPHAAVRDAKKPEPSVEEELARLNPPLYVPKSTADDASGSLKRRHLDNLTALLHQCMLKGDWRRASRIWGIVLRIEIDGQGVDVRQHGRWMVGAELLMRREQVSEQQTPDRSKDGDGAYSPGRGGQQAPAGVPVISDDGFKLARDYYERLILQFPHQPRAQHGSINALVIYPALFNIWIYEVQDRAKRARKGLSEQDEATSADERGSPAYSAASRSSEETRERLQNVYGREVNEALPIAQRLDELLLSPPYDASVALLEMRGMVALWLADMLKGLAKLQTALRASASIDEDDDHGDRLAANWERANDERRRARDVFQKIVDAGKELSEEYAGFLLEENDQFDQSMQDVGSRP